ncbi:MAG TPA: hypothetical protein DGD08_00065 [Gemmatimonas aurantiaca]|uniref:Uncharacterized protein n=2 Tax=Gemmatimonas aurantiaca TaxID=173480 RepID=C1A3U0_GEMAT|nr:hypothetical protein [Gemmatimonas aurantiaca]BAH37167.1 hypothetical protein GAU_0125 [Gemmatimonas aurantiaca T-27]HCT55583.1 hypothetical protein [Gemmatimonas aurantiaca]
MVAVVVAAALSVAACGAGETSASSRGTDTAAGAGLLGAAMSGVRPDGRDAAVSDSGPNVRVEFRTDSVRLVMDAAIGDQINALQPPVLELPDGRRLSFQGSEITPDSAYFVGDVALMLPRSGAPSEATLHTSYCRSGERLCRSVSRTVRITERAGD